MAIRTPAPDIIGATVQRLVAAIDADVPLANLQTMRQRISRDLAYPQFRAGVLGAFSAFALLLAFVVSTPSFASSSRSARTSSACASPSAPARVTSRS